MRATLPLLAIAAAFALGAAAARAAAAARPAGAFGTDFAQPLVVVTGWGTYGAACFAILAATVAFATLGLFAALRYARGRPPGTAAVALAAAAALAAAFGWPFVFSSDVYAYAAYGALAAHGADPYLPVPAALHDPFVTAARWQWQGPFPPCIYGPAFVAVARTIAGGGGDRVAAVLLALRLTSCAAYLGCIFVAGAALRDTSPRRRFALAACALNPVALWSVAEGHNDPLVLLAALAGLLLLRRGASGLGALAIGACSLVKATGAAFALGVALETYAFRPQTARSVALPLALGLAAAVVFGLPPLLPALGAAATQGRYRPDASVQGLVGLGPSFAAVLASAVYGVRRLRRRERDGYAWLGIAAWLALPNPYPWYALWLLPAVAAGSGAAAAALYGVTISSTVRYLPDATGNIGPGELHVAAALGASPLLFALAAFRRPLPL